MHGRNAKIRISAVLTASLLVVGFTGCAANNSSTEEAKQPASAAADASAAEILDVDRITWVVPYDPGGVYDADARYLAQALEVELGVPVVIENQPGAGGLLALNSIMSTPDNEIVLANFNAVGTAAAILTENKNVKFDMADVHMLGRVGWEPRTLMGSTQTGMNNSKDMLAATGFRFGSTGPGSASHFDPLILMEALPLKDPTIITGFDGTTESSLALTRGEVDGVSAGGFSAEAAVRAGEQAPLLVLGRERLSTYPDAPTILEMKLNSGSDELVNAYLDFLELGRMVMAPPSLPAEKVEVLRTALNSVMAAPAASEAFTKAGRTLDPLTGQDAAKLFSQVVDTALPHLVTVLSN